MLNINSSKSNFLLSGFFSISIYLFVMFIFFIYVKSHDVKKYDAYTKKTTLELEVLLDNSPVKRKAVQKKSTKTEKIVKKSKSRTVKQKADFKSLFANVKDKSSKVIEKKVNNQVSSQVSSRFKAKFEKERKTKNLNVSSLLENVKSKASVMPINSSDNEKDPYYSKIYELLAQRWNPLMIEDGLFAKVLVVITSSGEFSYKFLQYSGNQSFDASLTSFLNEQVNIIYPKHNKGSKTSIEVIFKAKG